ncbi:MAG: hypothetical protein ACQES5_01510 [Thermodesulfobacteriota bacterium]
MGRVLQIRVMAYTYSEKEVKNRWPSLFALAFEEGQQRTDIQTRGVLELISVLADKSRFVEDMDNTIREILTGYLKKLEKMTAELNSYLADRKPDKADRLSNEIEDELDNLEYDVKAAK